MIKRVQKNKEELSLDILKELRLVRFLLQRGTCCINAPMNGIWGREDEGSSSIVISGGYEDDIDNLDYILYTGQGGQDAPGGKQVSDQEFTRGNKGLLLSKEYNLPVRVTRGFQLDRVWT